MSTLGYFFPAFLAGNTLPCILLASVLNWLLTLLIIRGVESASALNAIVMVCKVISIGIFIVFAIFLFKAGVFTADFWGQVYDNAVAAGEYGAEAAGLGGIGSQVMNCMIIMMWVFIGIEGAAVVSSRAEKKSDAGKATVIGIICLLVIYIGASVLPFGYLPYTEIAAMEKPAMLYVFEQMAPGWGGSFISIAIIVCIAGAWLSFTILPTETSSEMAAAGLLPKSWGDLNSKGAPQRSLLITAACVQAFLIVTMFSEDAYNFAFSMCTVAIVVTWVFVSLFQCKISASRSEWGQFAIGAVVTIFLVVGCLYNGWSFMLLTCAGYIPGFALYVFARRKQFLKIATGEQIAMVVISALGVASLVMVAAGVITI